MVRKKQRMISKAMASRKMKLDNVSKPSQAETVARGSGKNATRRKTIGSNNHAIELLIEIELRLRQVKIIMNNNMAAKAISICRLGLVIFTPSHAQNDN